MPVPARATAFDFVVSSAVPDPGAAGVDLANYPLFRAPFDLEVTSFRVVPETAWIGAASPNDGSVALKNQDEAVTIGTLTVTTALAAGTDNDVTLTSANVDVKQGERLVIDVTTNGTADAPRHAVIVRYKARRTAKVPAL